MFRSRKVIIVLELIAVAACVGAGGFAYQHYQLAAAASAYQTPAESDPFVRFDMEAYDTISQHYWVAPGQYEHFGAPELPQLFQLAVQRVGGPSFTLSTTTRDGAALLLGQLFAAATSTSEKRTEATTILELVLNTLPPQGRDQLLSQQAQQDLQNRVDNTNPSNNLYSDLGLSKGATAQAVQQAYAQKQKELAASSSPAAQTQLVQAKQAVKVLSDPVNKTIYDQTGAEPTVFSHQLNSQTLYLDISSVAPTTIAEIATRLDAASTTPGLSNLIIDLRGNVGGDLDFAQEFLSLFFGPNQYAFDLYNQGQLEAQRTAVAPLMPELGHFKSIAVLTDNLTQSTAELVASALKHDRLATIVGTTTRGWGTVEHIYPLSTSIDPSQKYYLELVQYLTVRYDGNPIEGNGVVPDVSTSQSGWQSQLPQYFPSGQMRQAIESALAQKPLH